MMVMHYFHYISLPLASWIPIMFSVCAAVRPGHPLSVICVPLAPVSWPKCTYYCNKTMNFEGAAGAPKVAFEEHLGALLGASLGLSGAPLAPWWASASTLPRPKVLTGTRLVLLDPPWGPLLLPGSLWASILAPNRDLLGTTFNQLGPI